MEKDSNIFGCVGYIDISNKMNKYSPFILYQYAEYMYAQCLKRYAQSSITNKVNCLSGCNQILRVSEETCGNKILSAFNYLPKEDENIFNHIRSYASEDRNHVCLMLSMYPYAKTVQNVNAIAYTSVPTNLKVFASQRRRWNLGANSNDMLLIYLPGINIFERISAFINVFTFSITPFIFVATIYFIKVIITRPTMLMLYLSIMIIIPLIYSFFIPLIIRPLSLKQTLYYCVSFLFYIIFGSIINLGTFFYALINMDTIKWGKTRSIIDNHTIETNSSFDTDTTISINTDNDDNDDNDDNNKTKDNDSIMTTKTNELINNFDANNHKEFDYQEINNILINTRKYQSYV